MSKPVAHRFKWKEQEEWRYGDGYDATGAPNDPDYFAYEPLYTHPAKTLTDEEIESAYWSLVGKQHEGKIASYLYNFARAILKEASEK